MIQKLKIFSLTCVILIAGFFTVIPTDTVQAQSFGDFIDNILGDINTDGGATVSGGRGIDFNGISSSSGGNVSIPYGGPVFDGPGLQGGANIVEQYLDNKVSKETDVKNLIIGWVNFFLEVVALIAVLAIIWAGFTYITSLGDDSRIESAKKMIIWAAVGLILILGAYAIVNTVISAAFS